MLTIRDDQLTHKLAEENGFVQWYVHQFMPDHVAELHEAMDNATLERMIRNGRNEAIANGFSQPEAQVHFVTLMCKLGANFHHFPGFAEIAQAKDMTDGERIDAFYQVPDEQGGFAFENANERYWFPETMRGGAQ